MLRACTGSITKQLQTVCILLIYIWNLSRIWCKYHTSISTQFYLKSSCSKFMEEANDGTHHIKTSQWPRFLYDLVIPYNPEHQDCGLFHGPIVTPCARHIWTPPPTHPHILTTLLPCLSPAPCDSHILTFAPCIHCPPLCIHVFPVHDIHVSWHPLLPHLLLTSPVLLWLMLHIHVTQW